MRPVPESVPCGRRDRSDHALRLGLEQLRRDLVDLAIVLEHRGAAEAADLANVVAARLDGLERGHEGAG